MTTMSHIPPEDDLTDDDRRALREILAREGGRIFAPLAIDEWIKDHWPKPSPDR